MHRFLCIHLNPNAPTVEINDRWEIHHLKDVLRLKVHDKVVLFDGKGSEIDGTIISLNHQGVRVRVENLQTSVKRKTSIAIACAIPKKAKFETIIEKCTELGIDEIIPLQTHRTEIKLDIDKKEKKLRRYQTVAASAAKQCQRKFLPVIYSITDFDDAIETFINHETLPLISCLTGLRQNLCDIIKKLDNPPKRILFFIGPEGDFTADEIRRAIDAGCKAVSLGPNVLKVDTAAIAVTALTQLFLSDTKS